MSDPTIPAPPQPAAQPANVVPDSFDGFLAQYGAKDETPGDFDGFMKKYGTPKQYADFAQPRVTFGDRIHDLIFGDSRASSAARVLDAFGQGSSTAWGAQPLGQVDPEDEERLAKTGIIPHADENAQSFALAFNRGLMRTAAVALDTASRAGSAVFSGGQAAIHQSVLEATGSEKLASDIAAIPEAEMFRAPEAPHLPPDIAEARSLGVIGEGEAGWKGTVEPTPQTLAERSKAQAAAIPEPETPPPTGVAAAQMEPVTTPPDIHSVARQIDPETFDQYDRLTAQQGIYRRWINDFQDQQREEITPQQQAELQPLDDKIAELQARRTLTNAQQTRLDDALSQRDDMLARHAEWTPEETPEIQRAREGLMQTDYAMRDLAPQVSAAYREAQTRMPTEETTAEAPVAVAPSGEVAPASEEEPAGQKMVPQEVAEGKPPIDIASDVSQKLVAAGRPAEESQAAGALVQAYYETRAQRLGTDVQDLYSKEAPDIQGAVSGGRAGAAAGKTTVGKATKIITLFNKADTSTFIHETGHQWLEDLLKDASDDRAPDQLKTDAQTVRKWLGADPEGEIKTRQHEKFARGFERYMMEGVAPSKGLAGVFGQFRDWLMKIYQTVSRLRAPITDDIRQVFDRFLSTSPERQPVIAPERVEAETMASRHERLAEDTPPEKATEVADEIRDERHAATTPDIADRIAERPEPTPGSEGRSPEADRAGAGPEPVGASVGSRAEPGAVGEGGGQVAAEGPAARSESEGESKERDGPAKPLRTPDDRLGEDKAGNIRLDNWNTTEDIKAGLRTLAEEHSQFWGPRGGVISDSQRISMAESLGIKPSNFVPHQPEGVSNSVWAEVVQKVTFQAANEYRDAAKQFADSGSLEDMAVYQGKKDRLLMIAQHFSTVTAESGRTQRVFNKAGRQFTQDILAELQEKTGGRELFQMREEAKKAAALDTSQKISKLARDSQRPGFFDQLQSMWTNALNSNPITHATYTAAGDMLAIERAVVEGGYAGLVGKLRQVSGFGPEERVHLATVPAQLFGFGRGQMRGATAFSRAIRSGHIELPDEVTKDSELPIGTGQSWGHQGAFEGQGKAVATVGQFLEAPSRRMVAPLHSFNWTTFYEQSKARQAVEVAIKEGADITSWAGQQRVAELMDNPTSEMVKTASEEAQAGALMKRPAYDTFASRFSHVLNWGYRFGDIPLPGGGSYPLGTLRPLKFIEPFAQMPMNMMEVAFRNSPLVALFSHSVRDDLTFKNGGAAFDLTVGKILASTTMLGLSGWLAARSLLNSSGPSDEKERAGWTRINGMPHGLHVGSMTYDVLRMGPIGLQMATGANLWHSYETYTKDGFLTAVSQLVSTFGKDLLDESAMRGFSDATRAVDESDRYGVKWVRDFAATLYPYSVGLGGIAHQIDPYEREYRTLAEEVESKLPIFSEQLFPRRDTWGEPVPNKGWMLTYNQKVSVDPVDTELVRLGGFPNRPEQRIRGVGLTEQQYDDFSRIAGRAAKLQLNAVVRQPWFQAAPDEAKRLTVQKIITQTREQASVQVMMQYPSIYRQATINKRNGVKSSPAPE
jgi:hypothetical protein